MLNSEPSKFVVGCFWMASMVAHQHLSREMFSQGFFSWKFARILSGLSWICLLREICTLWKWISWENNLILCFPSLACLSSLLSFSFAFWLCLSQRLVNDFSVVHMIFNILIFSVKREWDLKLLNQRATIAAFLEIPWNMVWIKAVGLPFADEEKILPRKHLLRSTGWCQLSQC